MFLVLMSLIQLGFYFYGVLNPSLIRNNQFFNEFNTSSSILITSAVSALGLFSFFVTAVLLRKEKNKDNGLIKTIFIGAIMLFAICQWLQIYIGKVIYNQKVGMSFPILSVLLISLIIIKTKFSDQINKNFLVKILSIFVVIAGLYLLWKLMF